MLSHRQVYILLIRRFSTASTLSAELSSSMNMGKKMKNTDTLRHIKYKEKKHGKMPPPGFIDVQVVGTGAGGAPKAVVVNTEYFRYLFNCGEGTQRIASEHKMRISKLEQILFTHNSWGNIGGLLGMCLTLETVNLPKVVVHGPPNVEKLVTMSRGFAQLGTIAIEKKEVSDVYEDSAMKIEYVSLYPRVGDSEASCEDAEQPAKKKGRPSEEDMAVVYICKPHPKPRMLSLERCVDLGVPRGPLFGQLKNGSTITLDNGKQITPEDVLEPQERKRNFIVIEIPSEAYLEDLMKNEVLASHHAATEEELTELVVHLAPSKIMQTDIYQEWMSRFSPETRHLIVNEGGSEVVHEGLYRLQAKLNLLHDRIFPLLPRQIDAKQFSHEGPAPSIIIGRTGLRYYVRWGKALENKDDRVNLENCFTLNNKEYIDEVFEEEGFKEAYEAVKSSLSKHQTGSAPEKSSQYPEIVFLGTGSAMPNKVRNVSAILMFLNERDSMLMDCGEGTFGQIYRHFGNQTPSVMRSIKAIFISHLHADHHIGMCGVLEGRHQAFESAGEKCPEMLLVGPGVMQDWLDALYGNVLPHTIPTRLAPTENLWRAKRSEFPTEYQTVCNTLHLTEMETVRMWHRQYPHGLVMQHKDGWKLSYSGDTMPLDFFARAGKDSDILIHEATMEDGMEEDAKDKTHSTTSQAIDIGMKMKAKFILLTHFSQRYAKVPIISPNFTDHVGIAFDNMRVRRCDLPLLPLFMPALKAMFAEHYAEMELRTLKRAKRQEQEKLENDNQTQGKEEHIVGKGKGGKGKKRKEKGNDTVQSSVISSLISSHQESLEQPELHGETRMEQDGGDMSTPDNETKLAAPSHHVVSTDCTQQSVCDAESSSSAVEKG